VPVKTKNASRESKNFQKIAGPIPLVPPPAFWLNSKTMKRWAILTAALYALALILLTVPVTLVAFGNWGKAANHLEFQTILKAFVAWPYWLWLAVLVGGQILLLLVPIDVSQKRQPARRKLKVPVIVSAFFLANLFYAGLAALLCAIFRDDAFGLFIFGDYVINLFHPAHPNHISDLGFFTSQILLILIFWTVWALIFRRATKADAPDALIQRATRWLLRGSILELLIAVPSHVIVRRREDCCAPAATFWGIVTGLSVMLLCFGPGVFYLFASRMRKLKPVPPVK